uniref:Protein kinase domain-containing protein n=1 Tax=Arcella intermedia TaxID=1963864 RepID=A0A6B2L9X3_9EUKA
MKILKKSVIVQRGEIEHTKTERSVMSKIAHPFLVKLHWSFQTPDNLYFIMDFVNGGELFYHLSKEKRFSEDRAKFYAAEIISGIGYLHSFGIIYRDLKPENILLSNKGHVVMTDFGLAKEGLRKPSDSTKTFCGTPEYLAPEIIQGTSYTKSIDWWSVGTLIFEMLTGLPPFYTDDEEQLYQKILTADVVVPQRFSEAVTDLIQKLLDKDPATRLQDVDLIKKHAWFADIDWGKLERLEVAPSFVPEVKGPDDVSNIDKLFLKESLKDQDDDDDKEDLSEDYFGGFTFQNQQ